MAASERSCVNDDNLDFMSSQLALLPIFANDKVIYFCLNRRELPKAIEMRTNPYNNKTLTDYELQILENQMFNPGISLNERLFEIEDIAKLREEIPGYSLSTYARVLKKNDYDIQDAVEMMLESDFDDGDDTYDSITPRNGKKEESEDEEGEDIEIILDPKVRACERCNDMNTFESYFQRILNLNLYSDVEQSDSTTGGWYGINKIPLFRKGNDYWKNHHKTGDEKNNKEALIEALQNGFINSIWIQRKDKSIKSDYYSNGSVKEFVKFLKDEYPYVINLGVYYLRLKICAEHVEKREKERNDTGLIVVYLDLGTRLLNKVINWTIARYLNKISRSKYKVHHQLLNLSVITLIEDFSLLMESCYECYYTGR